MKIPLKPPNLDGLRKKHSIILGDLMGFGFQDFPEHKYLHWDQLRHRNPPTGLNHEIWWLGLKLQRKNRRRNVESLIDTHGKPFNFNMPDVVLAILHSIDSRANGRVDLNQAVATEENRDRYVFNSLVEEAITSSQLEGASTTRQVAADMIRYQRKPKDLSEQMILNNYRAMQDVRELAQQPLTYSALMELHRTLTEGTLAGAQPGKIQQPGEQRVKVMDNANQQILYEPAPADKLPGQLNKLIEFANREENAAPFIHPVVHALILHFWLAYLHPFVDGNGRTARALFYWAVLRRGYWLFEFISISRVIKQAPAQYAKAFLYTETDDNDLTYFLVHQLRVIERALLELEDYLKRKTSQLEDVEKLLKGSRLNHRQIVLLSHAIRHPGHEYSINSHQVSHSIAYATARADLMKLQLLGLLDGTRRGQKTLIFIAPDNLQQRIQTLHEND